MNRAARKSKPPAAPDWLVSNLWLVFVIATALFGAGWWLHHRYTFSFRSPVRLHFQSPVVLSLRVHTGDAAEDKKGRRLSAWQQYTCQKFGADCRLALAIQRAENQQGKCEVYHYNSNGTLDWGYFQINTVHLDRANLNLRDLLDCRTNIDFAFQLYQEKGGFTPWSTYNNGRYRQYLAD